MFDNKKKIDDLLDNLASILYNLNYTFNLILQNYLNKPLYNSTIIRIKTIKIGGKIST